MFPSAQTSNQFASQDASWGETNVCDNVQAGHAEPTQYSQEFKLVVDTRPYLTAPWSNAYCATGHDTQWAHAATQGSPARHCGSDGGTLSPASFSVQVFDPETSAGSLQTYQHGHHMFPQPRGASIVAGRNPLGPSSDDDGVSDAGGDEYSLASMGDRFKYYKDPNREGNQRFCCGFVYRDGQTRRKKRYKKLHGVLKHYASVHEGIKMLQYWKCEKWFSSKYSRQPAPEVRGNTKDTLTSFWHTWYLEPL
ncbi:hypothetical protein MANI_030109 [Metarhizium anisopliae]|nr:hypothetical protein MANI_030109 [Metarhizium anisopliae]